MEGLSFLHRNEIEICNFVSQITQTLCRNRNAANSDLNFTTGVKIRIILF